MKKIFSILLILLLIISLLSACGKPNNYYNTYNKKNLQDHTIINSIHGLEFEIPNKYFKNTKSIGEFKDLIFTNTDNTKYLSDILNKSTVEATDKDEFLLSDFNSFFYYAGHLDIDDSIKDYSGQNIDLLLKDFFSFVSISRINDKDFLKTEYNNITKVIVPIIHKNTDYKIDFKGYLSLIDTNETLFYFLNTYESASFDENTSLMIAKSFTVNKDLLLEKDNRLYDIKLDDFIKKTAFKENNHKIEDFTLNLNGNDIKLPMSHKDFSEKTGFVISDANLEKKIPANSTITLKSQYRQKTISVVLANTSSTEIASKDANIVGIKSDVTELYDNSYIFTRIVLPKNIIVHKSTMEDIIKEYGEPSKTTDTDNSDFKTLTYKLGKFESDIYTKIELTVNKKTNLLHSFEYTNLKIN